MSSPTPAGPGAAGTDRAGTAPRVVALGGGHGLAASLQALTTLTPALTAVVTVADDGGSSGRLREELQAVPPGDLRMALAALAGDDPWSATWERLLQHRFPGDGPLGGHAVGNLLITALSQTTGDLLDALDLVGRLVGAQGRVLPASCAPLQIVADVAGLDPDEPDATREIVGQVAVASTTGAVTAVRLRPQDPPACEHAVQAVRDADVVVLGPGSWFTSVLTHLLVPDLRAALEETAGSVVVTLNLAPQSGETDGFSPEQHLAVLAAHAPRLRVDVVLADTGAVRDRERLVAAAAALGAQLVLAPIARSDGTPRHDPQRLGQAYARLMHDRPRRNPAWR